MWRGIYDEDYGRLGGWELNTRPLFPGISRLSPVQEETSQFLTSPSSTEIWKQTDSAATRRPWSPLPPLIVEREKKINRHDEPEEYYQHLAKKMRILHRKLFIENREADTSSESIDQSLMDSPIKTLNKSFVVEDHGVSRQRRYSSASFEDDLLVELELIIQNIGDDQDYSVSYENIDINNLYQHNKECTNTTVNESQREHNANRDHEDDGAAINLDSGTNRDSSGLSQTEIQIDNAAPTDRRPSTSSSTTDHYQQVTFHAEVHRDPGVKDNVRLEYESSGSDGDGSQCDDALLKRTRFSDIITKVPPAHLSTKEVEVMRSPRQSGVRTSLYTSLQHSHGTSSEHISPEEARHSLEDYNLFDVIEDIQRSNYRACSDDFNKPLQVSTPKLQRKRRIDTEESSAPHSSFPTYKRVRYETVATQSDEISNWNFFRSNFFVGTPRMFKLCSCKDHRCGC